LDDSIWLTICSSLSMAASKERSVFCSILDMPWVANLKCQR
jgi:hypothetical protein